MAETTTDDTKVYLTYEQAVAMLPDGESVHTFDNSVGILIGADWSRQMVLDYFREHDGEIELAGETATRMGHGLAHAKDRRLFFATRK